MTGFRATVGRLRDTHSLKKWGRQGETSDQYLLVLWETNVKSTVALFCRSFRNLHFQVADRNLETCQHLEIKARLGQ